MLFSRGKTFREVAVCVRHLRRYCSRNTRLSARHQIGRLIRHFGDLPISQVTESDWAAYIRSEQRRRPRRFFDDRKYMRMILLHAFKEGLIRRKIDLPIPDKRRKVGREIRAEELQKLKNVAGEELDLQIDIGWKLGLRLREMMRLRWDQFDWDRKTIKLQATDTKTSREREVPIPQDLYLRLYARYSLSESSFVFPSPLDPSLPQHNNKTAWRRCKKKAKVKARWHDLRHTCASLLLRRGVQVHIARSILGMSDAVIRDIYTHLNLQDLHMAAAVMGDRMRA